MWWKQLSVKMQEWVEQTSPSQFWQCALICLLFCIWPLEWLSFLLWNYEYSAYEKFSVSLSFLLTPGEGCLLPHPEHQPAPSLLFQTPSWQKLCTPHLGHIIYCFLKCAFWLLSQYKNRTLDSSPQFTRNQFYQETDDNLEVNLSSVISHIWQYLLQCSKWPCVSDTLG